MSLALTFFRLPSPVDLRVLGLSRSYPEYLVVYQRGTALLRIDQGMLVNDFLWISVGVLVEGVDTLTHTSLLQEREQTDLEIATVFQGSSCVFAPSTSPKTAQHTSILGTSRGRVLQKANLDSESFSSSTELCGCIGNELYVLCGNTYSDYLRDIS
jgi:hypothetical protein